MQHSSSAFTLRKARRKDHPTIDALHDLTFREHAEREPKFTLTPFIPEFFKRLPLSLHVTRDGIGYTRRRVFLVEQNQEFCGYVAMTHSVRWPLFNQAIIADISVAPEMRQKGVASFAVEALTLFCRDRDIPIMWGSVWPENTASHALFLSKKFVKANDATQAEMAPMTVYIQGLAPTFKGHVSSTLKNALWIIVVMGLVIGVKIL